MSDSPHYKLRWRGREAGPFSVEEINRQLDEHEIGMGHEVYCDGQWMTVEEFLNELARPPAPPPVEIPLVLPPPPSAPENTASIRLSLSRADESQPRDWMDARPRYRLLFAVLAMGAGFAGAHNFYARQWLTGLLQLLLSVATWLMGFGLIASWLWAVGEAIFVRKDGNGIDMI